MLMNSLLWQSWLSSPRAFFSTHTEFLLLLLLFFFSCTGWLDLTSSASFFSLSLFFPLHHRSPCVCVCAPSSPIERETGDFSSPFSGRWRCAFYSSLSLDGGYWYFRALEVEGKEGEDGKEEAFHTASFVRLEKKGQRNFFFFRLKRNGVKVRASGWREQEKKTYFFSYCEHCGPRNAFFSSCCWIFVFAQTKQLAKSVLLEVIFNLFFVCERFRTFLF